MTTAHTTDPGPKKRSRTIALILGLIAVVAGVVACSEAASTKDDEAISRGNSGDTTVTDIWDNDVAAPTDDIAADATPVDNNDPYAGMPRKTTAREVPDVYDPYAGMPRKTTPHEVPDVYDSYSDPFEKEPSSAEVAAVATERGVLLHQWELGYIEQRGMMMKSYGIYNYDEYPNNNWLAWPVPTAGMTILMANPDTGKSRKCTLSGFVRKANTVYGVTAGHCVQGGYNEVYYKLANEPNVRPFGTVDQWQTMGKPGANDVYPFATDIALILVNQDVATSKDVRVATEATVVDMLAPDQITPGMKVCKMGYRSQESCGVVVASNDSEVRAHIFSLGGDSGSLLYTYVGDKSNRQIAVIGVLSSSPTTGGQTHDFLTDFALLAPIVDHDGTQYLG